MDIDQTGIKIHEVSGHDREPIEERRVTDTVLQQLARSAADGGPEERAAWLRARERAGERCAVPCGVSMCEPWGHVGVACRGGEIVHGSRDKSQRWLAKCDFCQGTGRAPLRAGVELAAYVGDEASRLVLGGRHAAESVHPEGWPGVDAYDLHHWAQELSRWGREASVRAAVAAARVALVAAIEAGRSYEHPTRPCPSCRGVGVGCEHGGSTSNCACEALGLDWECENCGTAGWVEDMGPERAIGAAEAWLACPCEEHLETWHTRWTTAVARDGSPWWLPNGYLLVRQHDPQPELLRVVGDAARITGEAPVREAIRDALTKWALKKQV